MGKHTEQGNECGCFGPHTPSSLYPSPKGTYPR